MLRELHIKNLALIEDATVEAAAGLNVFTGATGAGKSLVLGALELLLGGRASVQMVRPGAAEARVTGVFELRNPDTRARVAELLDRADWPADEDLILTRRITSAGRNATTLNGEPVAAATLRQVAGRLVDIHGQHEHQLLLSPGHQIEVLDEFADGGKLRREYAAVWKARRGVLERRDSLDRDGDARRREREACLRQAEEIEDVNPLPGEVERLDAERRRLASADKLAREAGRLHALLNVADPSPADQVADVAAGLRQLAALDPGLADAAESARSAAAELRETARTLARYVGTLEADPDRLTEVDDRLHRVRRLVTKYGGTVEAALAKAAAFRARADELGAGADGLAAMEAQLADLDRKLVDLGGRLRTLRQKAGRKLAAAVERELADLGMPDAKFLLKSVGEDYAPDPARAGATGFDDLEFLIAPNPGQPAHPLRRIASGGELSRVMLAVKGILADADKVSVLIFDEIDSNIGGRLGGVIGGKLRKLAARHQVFCITHLPQIAAFADRQFTVSKSVEGGDSVTRVSLVEGRARLAELAEMISGKSAGETTYRQAEEMLAAARG